MSNLTKAQKALLEDLSKFGGSMSVGGTYKPAQKLVELGYATMEETRFSDLLTITPEGRTKLEQSNEA